MGNLWRKKELPLKTNTLAKEWQYVIVIFLFH
jgi:hypothetical protein